ncbi:MULTISPECIES: hypothetical protein [unclassified Mesorhizobium]|uniref:hypothetical protein n=1 Tax=unclassified Mesorhizobium TaxID=325217 RepID=UPI000FD397BC|nr:MULTISPECIES: hypothetical protein [unclassified Mesorhizobium]RUX06216.1 hypothetical protein EOA35_05995 [Mesorhizobium sp. M8A.F.Ca.ET.023.01.1.1]RWC72817.1 MAG: hypothetical protein EOS71_18860 [Mesorhizobium sp.]TGR39933.1 hypothetical protein EN842_38795 [bacterium M00.F.Ca.ET.199.01.1.1]TGU24139.1 hypothetical protein EN799_48085 [bacterium M00.F.Ca.ET.156.01.1.1]TGV58246.1 hypothetical protein EN784_20555 [bacterium M00.F.Ca.ET.141.01.1.1]TGV89352.1 hypothetical protein EN792_00405
MSLDREWDSIRPERGFRAADAGMGVLRIALLFGSAAVALALIATPFLDSQTRSQTARDGFPGLDMTATGSISHRSTYTVRRSVLQAEPGGVCIIRSDGKSSGDC